MEAMEKSSTARTNPTARWKRLNATGDGNGDEDGKNLKNEYRTKQERSGRQKAAAKGNEDAKGVRDDRVTHAWARCAESTRGAR